MKGISLCSTHPTLAAYRKRVRPTRSGIEITREQNSEKAASIEAWANQVANTYNVLAMDAATFRLWATLMHRQSNTVYEDAMIAATALQHQLTVVTRNVKDFERFNVAISNPFED